MKPEQISPLSEMPFDEFERGCLIILRYFFDTYRSPKRQLWRNGYAVAAERWGEAIGLRAAHGLQKVAHSIKRCCRDDFDFLPPLDVSSKEIITLDEEAAVEMIHLMRRGQTALARNAVDDLTRGRMDPDIIRDALAFAASFPVGSSTKPNRRDGPRLHVVA